jgi:hypothetical protein
MPTNRELRPYHPCDAKRAAEIVAYFADHNSQGGYRSYSSVSYDDDGGDVVMYDIMEAAVADGMNHILYATFFVGLHTCEYSRKSLTRHKFFQLCNSHRVQPVRIHRNGAEVLPGDVDRCCECGAVKEHKH